MRFRMSGAAVLALAITLAPVARADDYTMRDSANVTQTMRARLIAGALWPVHLLYGMFGSTPTAVNVDATGNLGVQGQAAAGSDAAKAMAVQGITGGKPVPIVQYDINGDPVSPTATKTVQPLAFPVIDTTGGSTTGVLASGTYPAGANVIQWTPTQIGTGADVRVQFSMDCTTYLGQSFINPFTTGNVAGSGSTNFVFTAPALGKCWRVSQNSISSGTTIGKITFQSYTAGIANYTAPQTSASHGQVVQPQAVAPACEYDETSTAGVTEDGFSYTRCNSDRATYTSALPSTASTTIKLPFSFSSSGDSAVIGVSGSLAYRVYGMRIQAVGATLITVKVSGSTVEQFALAAGESRTFAFRSEPYYTTGAAGSFVLNSSNAVQIYGVMEYTAK